MKNPGGGGAGVQIDPSPVVSGFKTKYNADKTELEKKNPDTNKLVKKSNYNAKISELENNIPSISGFVTTSALNEVENKIPSVRNSVKKTDYGPKISELGKKFTDHKHGEYITTPEFNK